MKRLIFALLALLAANLTAPAFAQPSYANEETYIDNTLDSSDVVSSSENTTGSDESKLRFHCELNASQTNYDDSLLYPGLQGASPHAHQYFGNKLSNYASTYASLRTTGDSSCRGNKAARQSYWQSAMLNGDGKQVIAEYIQAYYTRAFLGTPIYALPNGIGFITGGKPGDMNYYVTPPGVTLGPNQEFTQYSGFQGYSCLSGGTKYYRTTDAGLQCAAGDLLRADFTAPNCWDGVNISSVDQRRHMAHEVRNTITSQMECPQSHPYQVARIEYAEFWNHCGYSSPTLPCSYRTYYVASDRQDPSPANWAGNGETLHLDVREAWNGGRGSGVRGEFEQYCVGVGSTPGGKACNDGYLGNGRALTVNGFDTTPIDESLRYIDLPARPGTARARFRLRVIH